MSLDVCPLASGFGAEILGRDLRLKLSDSVFADLVAAWKTYQVLLFRRQLVGDRALVEFARRFGELDPAPVYDHEDRAIPDGFPEITVVSNVVENNRHLGALGNGPETWHSNMTYKREPPVGCILHAWEVPDNTGFTWFSSLRAATAALPAELRARVGRLQSFHDGSYTSAGTLRHGYAPQVDPDHSPGTRHPFLIRHPSWQEEVLLLGRRPNAAVIGLEQSESDSLLEALWTHATRAEFTFRHVWHQGDVLIWDNLLTLHRREGFAPSVRRTLHRAQILRLHPRLRAADSGYPTMATATR